VAPMEIVVLVDNIASKPYIAQHGLSIIVKTEDRKILFDTGQDPNTLKRNLKLMGEDDNFDCIVISHGHYDHTDGLKYFIEGGKSRLKVPIYIHPEAFVDRYIEGRYIGIDRNLKKYLKKENLILVNDKPHYEKDMIVSGKVERLFPYEIDPFYMVLEDGTRKVDYVNDDMFIIVEDVVFTGCAHSGIINVIEYAKKINKNVRGVVGGFHLIHASKDYIKTVYDYLSAHNFEFIMPLHCTGLYATKVLSKLNNFIYGHVGKKLMV